jgi:hypothetical protein
VVKAAGMVRAAATAAAETFAPDEMEKHAQVIADAWAAKLKEQTREYTRYAMGQAVAQTQGGEGAELAGITSGTPPYAWFDLYYAGPFQFAPGAAFLPHKVIRVTEDAFMIGVLWRNPAPINFIIGNPTAADMMAALNFSVWFESVNLTNVSNGPDFGPFVFSPMGGGFINAFVVPIPGSTFPAPPQGRAHLYEINMTVDVTGPGIVPATLPFSGFATWQFDPDSQPPTLLPGTTPTLKQDIPARFLIHS